MNRAWKVLVIDLATGEVLKAFVVKHCDSAGKAEVAVNWHKTGTYYKTEQLIFDEDDVAEVF